MKAHDNINLQQRQNIVNNNSDNIRIFRDNYIVYIKSLDKSQHMFAGSYTIIKYRKVTHLNG